MSERTADYIQNERNARVFKSPILNFLSKTHISVPLVIFFGTSIALCAYSLIEFRFSLSKIGLLFLLGLLSFTLAEYLIHRYLYHLPGVYKEGKVAYALHGIHHKFPKDKKLLVMPPVLSVTLSSMILGLIYWIFGKIGFAITAGFLFGYAAYLSVHYLVHAFKPPKNIFRELWINHSIHHYQDDNTAFGVSSPLWDYVFGTMPDKKSMRKSS